MLRFYLLVTACVLMAQHAEGMSDRLAKYMKTSGMEQHCKDKGLAEEDCIKLLKKLCGIQRVSDPSEDDELKACLDRERCGQPLISMNVTRMRRADTPLYKWKKTRLTYMVYNTPPRTTLTKADLERMLRIALSIWGCYTKLDFSPARSLKDADFVLMFGSVKHDWFNHETKKIMHTSDGYPFDGEGDVLAHGFFPSGGDKNGNMHMDTAEYWSANLKDGTVNTFNTLVHELGHTLGLFHIDDYDNIMAPFYNGIREAEVDLGPLDIQKIQSLYGVRRCEYKRWKIELDRWFPKPIPTPAPDHPKCTTYERSYCNLEWHKKYCKKMCGLSRYIREGGMSDNEAHVCKKGALHGIFDFVDGYTYIIADGYLYRRAHSEGRVDMSFRMKISSLWKGAPAKPTAAVYSRMAMSLFLFQGKDMFVVSGLHGQIDTKTVRVRRVTVKDPQFPDSPSAAFIKFDDRTSGNVYLIKGHQVYVFHTKTRAVTKSFQFRKLFKVGKYGKRIPRAVDGAYHSFQEDSQHNPADSLLFFTGSSYTLAIPDEKSGKYKIPSGTRPFSTTFLNCPQE